MLHVLLQWDAIVLNFFPHNTRQPTLIGLQTGEVKDYRNSIQNLYIQIFKIIKYCSGREAKLLHFTRQ